jgi:hypothetical protein
MELTERQAAIRAGADGPVMARCMETLVRYGEACGARRLTPIISAHLTGSFKIFFYTAYYKLVTQLVEAGIRVAVPTTLNPRPGYDYRPQNRILFRSQRWHEEQLEALGVKPNYTCVCYAYDNIPVFGDRLGWAESSAIIYANSVIGARSNRNAIMIDLCHAVTGLAPEFGFFLEENRKAALHIKLEIERMDAAALGFLIGKIAMDRTPALDHWPFTTTELKNMGAAMASTGGVTMFHVVGLTPEAPDLETASGGRVLETHTIRQADLDALRASRQMQKESAVIAFGCPQMTLDEALEVGRHFAGKNLRKPVLFHLVPAAYDAFLETEIGKGCLDAGVEVLQHCPLAALSLRIGIGKQQVLTPSGKLHYYLEGAKYADIADILDVTGAVA